MEAPRCIVCGKRHWSRQACPAFAEVIAEEQKQQARSVTKPPPIPVTKPIEASVTKPQGAARPPRRTRICKFLIQNVKLQSLSRSPYQQNRLQGFLLALGGILTALARRIATACG